jgi:DNA (cytosine-5)-methyltransferase 1
MNSLELCAGAGGQAQGLERSGFEHAALVEIDAAACSTLRLNRPQWNVVEGDLSHFDATPYKGVDLVAGGVPCPPFSKAGKQLGSDDERDMFPQAIRVVDETRPKAVMLENVRGLFDVVFVEYRQKIAKQLQSMGYWTDWHLFNAADFGVSQLRPRVVCVAVRNDIAPYFRWPAPTLKLPPTVGALLHDLMQENGWQGADQWRDSANAIAPTLVGGSKKHGGPDLGPTRSRAAWAALGVDGRGLANEAPHSDFEGMPRLTVRMCARIQGFPDDWQFAGKKTPSYRQVGNAFPPPVAHAISAQIAHAIEQAASARLMKLAA